MALSRGFRLGSYEVVAPLGSGGMGEVYRARDIRLGRDAALKLLPEQVAHHPAWLARFRHEAQLLASLNHPNICTIYGLEEFRNQQVIAMEYVEGAPLSTLIGSRGLVPDTIIRYGIQIADALVHAHGRGIVHRDLKSANIMVTADARLKVLDFGLAIVANHSSAAVTTISDAETDSSAIVGTYPYMAPEVLRGETADARSDLWSFGVVLYEMATGKRPFAGRTLFELTSAIMRDPTPQPRATKRLPIRVITERCLAKDPQHRYQTAAEARAALESLQPLASSTAVKPSSSRTTSARLELVPSGPSIAVLPFTNLSPEPDQDYFCDGITEEIINGLTKIPGLHVAARTSVFRFKGKRYDTAAIRRHLKVDTILEGSVRKAGTQLRITRISSTRATAISSGRSGSTGGFAMCSASRTKSPGRSSTR
ncbi:MAG TPA: serine/threonine-protein kinase [Vicinamibacterales bacterium]|nr:serine/threonine-protein kinase [Vicinamibacterales bacterium]